jgi:ferritin-like metal-binding protein YciE
MPIDTTHSLFLHDLAAMYDAELQLIDVLPKLAAETAPGGVSDAFTLHADDTERHAENLRRCFYLLNVEPYTVKNHAIFGLAQDHDAFAMLHPSRDALIAFNLAAAAKTEHLEIASYIGLLRQAHTLGLTEVASLLAENLRVEQITSSTVEKLSDALARGQRRESGADIEEFSLSYYTEYAVPTPVVHEGTGAPIQARPTADRPLDAMGIDATMPPGRDARR